MSLDWNKLNQQKAALEEKLSKGGGTRAKFWKPQDGLNRIRVMPSWTSEGDFKGQFWREVAQHWNVSEEQRGPVLCPKRTPYLEGDCPICELVEALKRDRGNVAAAETQKEIRAKTAFLLNVVDLDDSEYTASDVAEFKKGRPDADVPFSAGNVKVQVYACPSTVFNQILSTIQVNRIDVTDATEGHDITIKKTGKGLKTRYETNIVIKPSAAPAVDRLPALDEVGYQMSFEDMTDLLAGGAGAEFVAMLPSTVGTPQPTSSPEEAVDGADELRRSMQAALTG